MGQKMMSLNAAMSVLARNPEVTSLHCAILQEFPYVSCDDTSFRYTSVSIDILFHQIPMSLLIKQLKFIHHIS